MTEKEVKQLIKLLDKLRIIHDAAVGSAERVPQFNARETQIISIVCQWVKWYGRDELGMDT